MKYVAFQEKILALLERSGSSAKVKFSNDTEKGNYCASFSDGTTIIASATKLNMTVRWGSGHTATASI